MLRGWPETQVVNHTLCLCDLDFLLVLSVNRTPIFPELPLKVVLLLFHLQVARSYPLKAPGVRSYT